VDFKGSLIRFQVTVATNYSENDHCSRFFSLTGLQKRESSSPVAPAFVGSHLVDRLDEKAGEDVELAFDNYFTGRKGQTSPLVIGPPQLYGAWFRHRRGLEPIFVGGGRILASGLSPSPVHYQHNPIQGRPKPAFLRHLYNMLGLPVGSGPAC